MVNVMASVRELGLLLGLGLMLWLAWELGLLLGLGLMLWLAWELGLWTVNVMVMVKELGLGS